MISLTELLNANLSTYSGSLDYSDIEIDYMEEDLKENSDENGKIKIGDKKTDIGDIECYFDMDRDLFKKNVCKASLDILEDYNVKDILEKYGLQFVKLEFGMPEYYNYTNDSLDIDYDCVDKDWNLEKYGLTDLVKDYIENVRVKSYDGYVSFEPDSIEKVDCYDYCVLYAILKKENIYDDLKRELENMAYEYGYDLYINSISEYHYYYNSKDYALSSGDLIEKKSF